MKSLKTSLAAFALIIAACGLLASAARADDGYRHENMREHWDRVQCHEYNGTFGPNGCYIPNRSDRQRLIRDTQMNANVYVRPAPSISIQLP